MFTRFEKKKHLFVFTVAHVFVHRTMNKNNQCRLLKLPPLRRLLLRPKLMLLQQPLLPQPPTRLPRQRSQVNLLLAQRPHIAPHHPVICSWSQAKAAAAAATAAATAKAKAKADKEVHAPLFFTSHAPNNR